MYRNWNVKPLNFFVLKVNHMRSTQLMFSLFLASVLFTTTTMAADTTSATPASQAKQADKLEKISDAPVSTKTSAMKDCPMHQGKKECDHKNGEPCPMHQNDKHHGKSHDHCDHRHPG
jgi:hypothetical protein